MSTGYSGTPLAKKLGYQPGFCTRVVHPPTHYMDLLQDLPLDVQFSEDPSLPKNLVHYFAQTESQLIRDIASLQKEIVQNGMIWISWPKKSANIATDLTENRIREIGLENGLVDVKVCAVDSIWSGLKFVIRVKDRK